MGQNATVERRDSSELRVQNYNLYCSEHVRTAASETQAETEALKKVPSQFEMLVIHKRSVKQANRSKLEVRG